MIDLQTLDLLCFLNLYKTPKTLGSDRIALAVGAESLFPNKNCLIIGTGTCITTDFLDENKCYQGGSISPGLTLRLQSLHTFTDMLPLIEHKKDIFEYELLGKSTKGSIESGVFNGAFAEIDGTIYRYKQNYKDLTIILTGGDQEIFAKNLKSSIFANSNIQAIGLNTKETEKDLRLLLNWLEDEPFLLQRKYMPLVLWGLPLLTFGLIFITGIIAMLGILACGIGVLFTLPLVYLPVYFIYRDVVGFDDFEELDQIGNN